MVDELDFNQQVRNYIYSFTVEHTRPPTVAEAAQELGAPPDRVREAYLFLGEHHAVFLEPGAAEPRVRMAFPFSAIPTPFRVTVQGKTYFANCAWDMLGIPAALHQDAAIEASCADCGEPLTIHVRSARVIAGDYVAHFLLPFRQWYADLADT